MHQLSVGDGKVHKKLSYALFSANAANTMANTAL